MGLNLENGKLVERVETVIAVDFALLCRQREGFKKDLEHYTRKLEEVEARIEEAKKLGFVEEVVSEGDIEK